MKQTFGEYMRETAGRRNLSLTKLSVIAGVHITNLSKIANGRRPCGLSMAVRLADALDLGGPERTLFLQLASSTTTRKESVRGRGHLAYPAELRDLVIHFLSGQGIHPDYITAVEGSTREGCPILRLRSGDRYALRVTMTRP